MLAIVSSYLYIARMPWVYVTALVWIFSNVLSQMCNKRALSLANNSCDPGHDIDETSQTLWISGGSSILQTGAATLLLAKFVSKQYKNEWNWTVRGPWCPLLDAKTWSHDQNLTKSWLTITILPCQMLC